MSNVKILFSRTKTIREYALVEGEPDESLDDLRDRTDPASLTSWGVVKDPDFGNNEPDEELEFDEEDSIEGEDDESED